ncbi:MAG: S8 family peptidase [Sedimentitalea sp.]|uniref:S8 family peptidase n=1 Tax=Sedimentitalea sp. TaxID=2048915 RepID=UPI0032630531
MTVRLQDFIKARNPDETVELIEAGELGPWPQLAADFPGLKMRPRWHSIETAQLEKLLEKAQQVDPSYRPGPIFQYFEIICPNDAKPSEIIKRLKSWSTVADAWHAPVPQEPPVTPNNDPRFPNQGYLDPAPEGIDAEFAWTIAGGDGAGQNFVDIEWGWTLNHEDLVAHGAALLSGLNNGYEGHGTAVLGEVAAVDNAIGCVGITPELASVNVIGQWRTATDFDIADAILDACGQMGFGDVLLLEAHNSFNGYSLVPVEAFDDTYEMIRLATALGIIVVEAGGNGGEDLNLVTNTGGENFFDPTDASFRDSGAIIVGAASDTAPHSRLGFSSHGERIDCYGWGEGIDTTGDGWTGTSTSAYTSSFGGTSGASPIVTGAALSVQGMVEAATGGRLSPAQMRAVLTNPATSTASDNPMVDRIGVMPNLRAIIEAGDFNMRPDVYIRDYVGDTGDPHAGAISASPDVILVPATVADPQLAYGDGSGTENLSNLGYEATGGQDNFVYLRSLNRGGALAAGTTVDVFWSPASTLVTPDLWQPVGSLVMPNLPTGDTLVAAGPITWAEADLPAPGHYCFVAILSHPQDPGATPADFLDWDNFRAFIRNNNNVTWRNFNVVPNTPPPGLEMIAQKFLMAGAFDKTRKMRLEIALRLPKGAKALLNLPPQLAESFLLHRSPFLKIDKKDGSVGVPLNPAGITRFRDFGFPPKIRHELELRVSIPEEQRDRSYLGWAAQFEGEEELGRVTWSFASAEELKKRDAHLKQFAGKPAV